MIEFDLPKEKSSIIKVIGIGGGGSNAVTHMYNQHIEGVNFIICNTDAQSISQSEVPNKIQLGPHLTQGLGAGANPEIGRQATEESLEEIKRILEVNTKMAFVTAGMGGGTGTGGAPIISKICKDLGILTVGIVTTPFSYEGKKRQLQADEGIKNLKQYVDTLLVISNDKLRHQFGNLKMREAFAKADNVLATAAKCITDVINSTGQINVDFADVCTVMRNGGVAILGNAACDGEGRAQRAIEEALSSPLLNDNEISGAKWILININSAEGEHEFTMDEVDVIQNYLLSQAGEYTDVILGLGYDNSLGNKISITLIATGFEFNDPFTRKEAAKPAEAKKEDKIVMRLGDQNAEAKKPVQQATPVDPMAPTLVEDTITLTAMEASMKELEEELNVPLGYKEKEEAPVHLQLKVKEEPVESDVEQKEFEKKKKMLDDKFEQLRKNVIANAGSTDPKNPQGSSSPGAYSNKPASYADYKRDGGKKGEDQNARPAATDDETFDMQLVVKSDANGDTAKPQPANTTPEESLPVNDAEEHKRRLAERLQKLRNLSFNVNNADPNNEFEAVPAYIRRNMDLHTNNSSVENFYSNYTVKDDGKNGGQISTINTFLEGKKPD